MSTQKFCVRWNNHQPNFISVLTSLLHNGTLVDVTLAAEGRQLQAHKVVLSACSSYFQTLFTTNPCQHPIIILKDVQYNHLKIMVDFMYYGEVNVSQEQLPHILKTAEMLKIKGLTEMTDESSLNCENRSSFEPSNQLQGNGGNGNDGESQFQQQHQHHHHQQQQQLQQQQHQQASQQHEQRRTPSPSGVSGVSPSTRRKRLRKSPNSGSTERMPEEQSSVEDSSNINLSQMDQMSFSGPTTTNLGQNIYPKVIKDSSSTDTDTHPQDSSQDGIEDSTPTHQHIKPETDISSVQQSIPLDISGPGTPSELRTPSPSCSQPQSSHSDSPSSFTGELWTVVDSKYTSFTSNISSLSSLSYDDNNQQCTKDNDKMTTKRRKENAVTSNPRENSQLHHSDSLRFSRNLSTSKDSSYGGNTSSQQIRRKRKWTNNPQGDENFLYALEAVRSGGIGFCKAARLYGVNNRTLWLEYKKRGYPICRPSIKNRKASKESLKI